MPAALAAEGLSNFKTANTYETGRFSDVPQDAWFSSAVGSAYELGLMKGTSDTLFSPDGNISIAETLALACRLHNLYFGGGGRFNQGTPWYGVYENYAVANGIIQKGQYGNLTRIATRAQFASILAKALPAEALEAINELENGDIPDVFETAAYAEDVLLLYRAGILTGSDEYGNFEPDTAIGRSSVAAIVTRMAVPVLRKELNLTPDTLQIETEYYTVSVPASWNGFFVCETGENWLSFYEKQSRDAIGAGHLFTILLTDEEYTYLPSYSYLGELSAQGGAPRHLLVTYPTGVQFIESNQTVAERYLQLRVQIGRVVESLTPKDGYTLTRPEGRSWSSAYAELLEHAQAANAEERTDGYLYTSYTVYDIDKDGTPELFLKYGTCEADYVYFLYTFREMLGDVETLATLPAGHAALCGMEDESAFLIQKGHMGGETITKYVYRDCLLTGQTVYQSSDDLNHEYAALTFLPEYPVDTWEGLSWNQNPSDENQSVLDRLK